MDIVLNDMEARVLGSLLEKMLATPDYYPLSLNALTNACNQKSNREPVVSYDEAAVEATLDELGKKGLVSRSTVGRVAKYEETFTGSRKLVPREISVLCVLLLRGSQTPGLIRGRTDRLHHFESLEALHETLKNLEQWGYVKRLQRLPGHKESRYVHLLCGEPRQTDLETTPVVERDSIRDVARIEKMEQDMEAIRIDMEELKNLFRELKKQFE